MTLSLSAAKAEVKAELDQLPDAMAKLRAIWQSILEPAGGEVGDILKNCVRIIHLLLLNKEQRQITRSQLDQLSKLFEINLKFVSRKNGAISCELQRDFHLALSQMLWLECRWLDSLWEQSIAVESDRTGADSCLQMLARGLRLHRLGILNESMLMLERALMVAGSDHDRSHCFMLLMRAHRISGNLNEVLRLQSEGEPHCRKVPQFDKEYSWELVFSQVWIGRSPVGELEKLIRRGGSHRDAAYIIEYFLILMCVGTEQELAAAPKLKTFVNQKLVAPQELGTLYDITRVLLGCYGEDNDNPFILNQLGDFVSKIHLLPLYEQELMTLVALHRWLEQKKFSSLSQILRFEIRRMMDPRNGINREAQPNFVRQILSP